MRIAPSLLAASVSLLASTARAHDIADPSVVVLTLRGTTLEVRISETWGVGDEAVGLRRRYDTDHNGELSVEEQERLKVDLRLQALAHLTVRSTPEGTPLDVQLAATRGSGLSGPLVNSNELRVEVAARVELRPDAGGVVRAIVEDFRTDDHDVRVAVVVADGTLLVRAQPGDVDPARRAITGIRLNRRTKSLHLSWREAPSEKGVSAKPDPTKAEAR